eukprot:c24374_g1_i3 orf=34-294(-)
MAYGNGEGASFFYDKKTLRDNKSEGVTLKNVSDKLGSIAASIRGIRAFTFEFASLQKSASQLRFANMENTTNICKQLQPPAKRVCR